MKAVIVTCPHCGARLRVEGTALQTVCEYCGTAARLQRRTRLLARALPPTSGPDLPRPVAVQRRTLVLPLILAVGAVGVAGVVMGNSVSSRRSTQPTTTTHMVPTIALSPRSDAATVERSPRWEAGNLPLLADIDGDGSVEIARFPEDIDRALDAARARCHRDGEWYATAIGSGS